MTNLKQELSELMLKFEKDKKVLFEKAKSIYMDNSLSVDDRWKVYTSVSDYMSMNGDWNIPYCDSPYDDLYCEKYQTFKFSRIENDWGKFEELTKEQFNECRIYAMESGYGGFIYDW